MVFQRNLRDDKSPQDSRTYLSIQANLNSAVVRMVSFFLWFPSLKVFRLLSSSLFLFSHHFDRYVLRPSSGVCRTRKPSRNFKLREGSRVRQTPEEGRKTYRPKRCGNNNKDEDNSPKTLNDKNHLASSQKFRWFWFPVPPGIFESLQGL